ncbi:putative C6 transcription factor [Camillea tinctor]|nr:putative C6 transcription factor [Camillea tinctor]
MSSPIPRRLPTRVTKACRRCRRNKSRCDSFRPCSLCLRADVDCEAAEADTPLNSIPPVGNQSQGLNIRKRPRSRSGCDEHYSPPVSRTRRVSIHPDTNRRDDIESQPPATACTEASNSWATVDYTESDSAMGIARKIYRLGSQSIGDHMISAIPDGGNGIWMPERRHNDKREPISVILRSRFPDPQLVNSLLEEYFDAVHCFSLVIFEPKFRQRLAPMQDGLAYPSDESFLTLLSMVLCMAAWYRSKRTNQDDAKEWSSTLLNVVESRLVKVMDRRSIAAVQTCILLGSHHLYHGRPNLSFALLGATIKISQAMGLHRKSDSGDPLEVEERKRIWWTIYTWDRFASISYGRPLSINDEDFTVEMPSDFPESPYFVEPPAEQNETGILYAPYQRELNRMYLIASPALKYIFGSLAMPNSKERFRPDFSSLVNEATQKLAAWRHQLPPQLMLDLNQDYVPETSSWSSRAHVIQSLSLQLTFDNIMIVLYRPFLSRKVEHLSMNGSVTHTRANSIIESSNGSQAETMSSQDNNISVHDQLSPMSEGTASLEHWWNAALRTAQVTELPQLAQLATDSHLVAFMAINLFNAAIVLISLALSDPLSDRAQGAKRLVTKIFRLQEILGQRSALSRQSSVVLKNLIYLLLRQEVEAMLAPVPTPTSNTQTGARIAPRPLDLTNTSLMSVGDTLRLPLEATLSTSDHITSGQNWSSLSKGQRLNQSLASVQRVFPSFQDQLLQQSNAMPSPSSGPMEQDCASRLPPQDQQPWQSHIARQDVNGEEEGNDLFWLWDVTWDTGYA